MLVSMSALPDEDSAELNESLYNTVFSRTLSSAITARYMMLHNQL